MFQVVNIIGIRARVCKTPIVFYGNETFTLWAVKISLSNWYIFMPVGDGGTGSLC